MTCLIASSARGLRCRRSSALLLPNTWRVHRASWWARGTRTTWTEPLIMLPEYWSPASAHSSAGSGEVGPHGLGPAPTPLVLPITSRRPSGVAATDDGYQAVGM